MAAAKRPSVFEPPAYLRNPMLQTFWGSRRPLGRRVRGVLAAARPLILTASDGTRLGAACSRQPVAGARGLAILLHGWEGSIASTYTLAAAQVAFDARWDVLRLNFRDHGDTHHLNAGLFYSTRLDEVYDAVVQGAAMACGRPVVVCGFSLGGNFALRIAERWSNAPPAGIDLRHVVAVSPVLDPSRATDAIDRRPLIRHYFRRKWQKSLRRKQQLYPSRYDFAGILRLRTIRQMTAALLAAYSDYPDTASYFAGYTVDRRAVSALRVPATLITAADDPVIPVSDFYHLAPEGPVRLIIHAYGGHNGFIANGWGRTWYEAFLAGLLQEAKAGGDGTC